MIKKGLKKYSKDSEAEIATISTIDAEIFSEIMTSLTKLNQKELCDILVKYKEVPDKDLLDLLLNFNINLKEVKDSDDNHAKKEFITIENSHYLPYLIQSFERDKIWNFKRGDYDYLLIMNRSEDSRMPYKDTQFLYEIEEVREEAFDRIKNILAIYNIIFV
jgi:hypothetical protein